MLKGMSAEQRYRMIGRLRDDVLTPVVEEKMSLGEHGVAAVLEDTLKLLSWSQINIFRQGHVGGADDELRKDGDGDAEGGANVILRNIQLVKLRKFTMPILIELRQLL